MKSLMVELDPQLEQPGGYSWLEGVFDETSYEVGGMTFHVADELRYDLTLSNTGDMIVLRGRLQGKVEGTCARCLKPASFDLDAEVESFFLPPTTDPEQFDLAEDEFEPIPEDGRIDLAPALQASLVYETPQVLLCRPDCRGLCPQCGADLNEGDCGCAPPDDIDETNPFSVLRGMFDASDDAAGEN